MTTITATQIRAFRVVGADGAPETFLHDSDWMGMSAYTHPTLGTLIVTPASGPAAQAFAEILGLSSTMNVVSGSPNALEFIGASPSAVQPPQSLIDEIERLSRALVNARNDALEAAQREPGQEDHDAVRTLAEWHEDDGPVVWWRFLVDEPAWIGTPLDDDWPGYHTHWTPHPKPPERER